MPVLSRRTSSAPVPRRRSKRCTLTSARTSPNGKLVRSPDRSYSSRPAQARRTLLLSPVATAFEHEARSVAMRELQKRRPGADSLSRAIESEHRWMVHGTHYGMGARGITSCRSHRMARIVVAGRTLLRAALQSRYWFESAEVAVANRLEAGSRSEHAGGDGSSSSSRAVTIGVGFCAVAIPREGVVIFAASGSAHAVATAIPAFFQRPAVCSRPRQTHSPRRRGGGVRPLIDCSADERPANPP